MIIGAILPHSQLYGGVKRFFELGNLFVKNGHQFIIFNEKGDAPDWFTFNGTITTITELENYQLGALFFTEPKYYPLVANANTIRRIFYFVKSRENLKSMVNDPRFEIFANSTNLFNECTKRYGVRPFRAFGGIDISFYNANPLEARNVDEPFVVLAFGRLSKKRKGTKYIVKACERVYRKHKNIKLILFDTPTDKSAIKAIEKFNSPMDYEFVINHPYNKNPELFHRAHILVSAEYKTGYSNTSAEAMSCGLAVIGTKSGTQDFLFHEKTGLVVWRNRYSIAKAIRRLMFDEALRLSLAAAGRSKIEEFSWDRLYEIIATELNASSKAINKP